MTIFVSEPLSFEGFTVIARAEDIDSDFQLWVTDETTQEETVFPSNLFPLFATSLYATICDAKWNQEKARMNLYHPMQNNSFLVDHSSKSNYLVIDKDIALSEGAPAIYWANAPDAMVDQLYPRPGYAANWARPAISGWQLVLSGHEDTALGFAAWNDPKGIQKLVDNMCNPEELFVMSALLDPERARILVAQQMLASLHERKAIPQMSIAKVISAIKCAGLESKYSQGYMRLLRIPLNGRKIPVAIGIIRPIGPVRTKDQDEEAKSWPLAFRKMVESTNRGWRFVDAPRPNRSLVETDYEIWITRISVDSWDAIFPLVEVTAGSFRISLGEKF